MHIYIYKEQISLALCSGITQKTPLVLIFIIILALSSSTTLCVLSYISGFGFDHSSRFKASERNFIIFYL
jgi:hypothetical protein